MARLLDDASSQYLNNANAPVTAVPLSLACWFNVDSLTLTQTLVSISRSSGGDSWFDLRASGAVGGDPVGATTYDGAALGQAYSSAAYSINTWQHGLAVFAATNSRSVYLNGANKVTDTTSITPSGINSFTAGVVYFGGGLANLASGALAELAVWNIALTDDDAASLAKGFSPLLIRPQSLIRYCPLIGKTSPEIELARGFGLTLVNTPTATAHPRMIYPSRAR